MAVSNEVSKPELRRHESKPKQPPVRLQGRDLVARFAKWSTYLAGQGRDYSTELYFYHCSRDRSTEFLLCWRTTAAVAHASIGFDWPLPFGLPGRADGADDYLH